MAQQFVLFEHAAGYALFKVQEFEEIAAFQAQVESSVTDFSRFNSVVKFVGFGPFKNAANALENINSVSEGIVTNDLQSFLDFSLPKTSKGSKTVLGVSDAKLGAAIAENLPITCNHVGIFPEIIRGVRLHFASLLKGFTPKSSATAQLGLGHAYSRAKVKFNVHRADNMVIQSIALLDQLDKDINTFSMRIREWYSYHFPELVKIVPENYTFARLAQFIKNRKDLTNDKLEALEEITMDSARAQAIIDASRSSMGMDIAELDLLNIDLFATRVIELSNYRKRLAEYLSTKMSGIAPNLQTLIGDQVGARLIAHAGSLTNLAKYPSSTVQILGAEKALFRALKTRTNTPKYGLLYNSTFIGRAGAKNKGRISRYLANKCSIASRIDCFSDNPTSVFGDKLKQQVEDRLKFYEQGDIPRKNIDVMKEAMEEAAVLIEEQQAQQKKKKKKDKKKAKNGLSESVNDESINEGKKKKRKNTENGNETLETSTFDEDDAKPKKKKKDKNRKSSENGAGEAEEAADEVEEEPVKKKKKKKNAD